jgi:aromatic-L-amino-acid decarboxylase
MLTAAIVSNAMLWRTSPAATELEQVTVDWLRQGFGLPATVTGLFTDTASTSSLIGLAAARERAGRAVGEGAAADGLAGAAAQRIYISAQAHSSIDKAAMILGIGRAGVRHIATDDEYAMDVAALRDAIAADRAAGYRPAGIVATVGTTSSTAVDPVAAIADVAQAEDLWLHVDAAYAGATALLPERRGPFDGWERADSIVVNPHKWLFTPLDCSLFLTRDLATVHAAFSLRPEYLRTLDRDRPVVDFNEFQPQLGRRFRALKMWFLLRYFGLEGLRSRLREHLQLASRFADWVDAEPDAERLAPVPFSTVCFRWRPAALTGRESEPDVAALLDRLNEQLMARVNATGEVFLSHTRLRDRFTIRLAIGNVRTAERHVARAWELLQREGHALAAELR